MVKIGDVIEIEVEGACTCGRRLMIRTGAMVCEQLTDHPCDVFKLERPFECACGKTITYWISKQRVEPNLSVWEQALEDVEL